MATPVCDDPAVFTSQPTRSRHDRAAIIFVATVIVCLTWTCAAVTARAATVKEPGGREDRYAGVRVQTRNLRAGAPPWSSCSVAHPNEQKIIKKYLRKAQFSVNGGPTFTRGTTTLRCGASTWGYFHFKRKHEYEFENLALEFLTHQNWDELADLALVKTLEDSDRVTHSDDRKTFCLSARLDFYEGKKKLGSHWFQTILGDRDFNIISVYPSEGYCKANSHD